MADAYFTIALVFAALKLFGVFKSSWLWALSPIWLPILARFVWRHLFLGGVFGF